MFIRSRILEGDGWRLATNRASHDGDGSGAIEANAGGASVEAISARMGDSIDENEALPKTYMTVDLATVRSADDSRKLVGQDSDEYKKAETLWKMRVETFSRDGS